MRLQFGMVEEKQTAFLLLDDNRESLEQVACLKSVNFYPSSKTKSNPSKFQAIIILMIIIFI